MSEKEELKAKVRLANAESPRVRSSHEWPSRREFLIKAGATAALVGGTGILGWALRDPTGQKGKPKPPTIRLDDFRVQPAAGASVLGIARGEKYDAMLRMAIGAIGGITHYIRKGDVVLIKPNVAFDRAPRLGATTNPEV